MTQTPYALEDIGRIGEELYEQHLRPIVDTPENLGRQVVVDVKSGDYEVGDDGLTISRSLLARRPDGLLYGKRIGYNAVYTLGGVLEPKRSR